MRFVWAAIRWLLSLGALATAAFLGFAAFQVTQFEASQWARREGWMLAGAIVVGAAFALLFFAAANPLVARALGWRSGRSQWTGAILAVVFGAASLVGIVFLFDRLNAESYKMRQAALEAIDRALRAAEIEAFIDTVMTFTPDGVFEGRTTFDRESFFGSVLRADGGDDQTADAASLFARDFGIGNNELCTAVPSAVDEMDLDSGLSITEIKEGFDRSERPDVRFLTAEMHRLCQGIVAKPDPKRGFDLMQGLAEEGNATALALVGLRHRIGSGTDRDPAAAAEAIRQAAEAGDPLGLLLLADAYEHGLGPIAVDKAAALQHYEEAAEADQIDAIDRLTRIHAGEIGGFDGRRARLDHYVNKLCALGACQGTAEALQDKGEDDTPRFRSIVGYLCLEQDASWCVAYSYILENGVAGPARHGEALRVAEKACLAEWSSGCINASIAASSAKGDRKADPVKARSFAETGCELGADKACHFFADDLRLGRGGAKDETQAREIYARLCDEDDLSACAEVGRQRWLGTGGPKDQTRGLAALEKACAGDDAFGCHILSMAVRPTDPARARKLQTKACNLGRKEAC